jgi:phenylacetate-CoA ligase
MRPAEYLNERMETIHPDELRSLQRDKFLRQLDYAFEKSPFYRQKFGEFGIQRHDIKDLEDLAKLPFTYEEELQRPDEGDPSQEFHHDVTLAAEVVPTGGYRGPEEIPTFAARTENHRQVWNAVTTRSLFTEGIRKGDIVIHTSGLTSSVRGLSVSAAIEDMGASFVPIESDAPDRVIAATKRLNASVLHCTPTYALNLAEYCEKKHGLRPSELGFKKLMVGGEPGGGLPSMRTRLEEDYQARVTEGLGNPDAGPIICGECPEQNGMHFCAQEHIYCELIDPASGEILDMKEGAEGELVYSLLDRECYPLIRFRTRDRVAVFTVPCRCGRTSFRVQYMGRTRDMLIVLGINVFPAAVRDVITSFRPKTSGEVLILLDRPSHIVEAPVRILVEYVEGMTGLTSLKKALEEALRHKLLLRADVEFVREGTLPRHEVEAKLTKIMYG